MTLYDQVKAIFDKAGVPPWIWYPIAIAESGGRPNVLGDNGQSVGLFQLNMNGGQGTGYSPAQLADPLFNAQVASAAIASAWNQVKSDGKDAATQLVEVMQLSGHPGNVGASNLFTVAQAALGNFLGRGSLPAPEFGGIFKGGFFPGISIPMLGVGSNMVPAWQWGTGVTGGTSSQVGFMSGILPDFNLLNFFAGVDVMRIGIGFLGVALIFIALVAFLWRPAVQATGEVAKVAVAAA